MSSEERIPAVVAPSSEATVLVLAHLIAEAVGLADIEVTDAFDDGPASLPMSGRPTLVDSVPASIALGLVPSVELDEGVRRTVGWFEPRTARPRRTAERTSGVFLRGARDTISEGSARDASRRLSG